MAIPSLEHVMAFGDVTTSSTGLLYYGIDDGELIISRYIYESVFSQAYLRHVGPTVTNFQYKYNYYY